IARRWCVLFLRTEGGEGAIPDEIYKDRGASFVGQANTLKEIYVRLMQVGRGRRMRVTRRRCQPAGKSISASAGVSTANSAAGPKTICRRQAFAWGQRRGTASIAGCH